jgi:hypothetical protein
MIARIRKVEPIGTRTVYGHQNRGDQPHVWGPIDLPEYPPSPNGARLRARRVELDLSLREAARVLGFSAVELNGLERGSHATDDWDALLAALEGAKP